MRTQLKERDLNLELVEILETFVRELANLPGEPKKSHLWFVGHALLTLDKVASHRRAWENMLNKQFGGNHADPLRGIPKL